MRRKTAHKDPKLESQGREKAVETEEGLTEKAAVSPIKPTDGIEEGRKEYKSETAR